MSPGPKTRSSSPMEVENVCSRSFARASLTEIAWAGLADFFDLPEDFKKDSASVRVFHSWQAGHWPDHLANSLPHWEQKKTVVDLDTRKLYPFQILILLTIPVGVFFKLFEAGFDMGYI